MKREQFIARLQDALLRRCDALRHDLAEEMFLRDVPYAPARGDLADLAIDQANEEARFLMGEAEARELARIEHALDRIREGSYGVCEACGEPIAAARLRAVPHATRCLSCQRKAEELAAVEGRKVGAAA